jgi:hypothetical protein
MFSAIHLSLPVNISLFYPNVHQSLRPGFQLIADELLDKVQNQAAALLHQKSYMTVCSTGV